MNILKHSCCDAELGVSPEQAAQGVVPLPYLRAKDDFGGPTVVSFWQPNAEELKMLNEGYPAILIVAGRTHPPVYVGVSNIKE